jgi:pumilio homology domain family member 6
LTTFISFENPEKGAVSNAIVHCALWEYVSELELLSDQAEAERLRREIIDLCLDTIAEMVHTRHGSLVSRYLLAYGTAKDRKAIIKLLRPHIERIALDTEAQLVLFTVLDVTDDTKMLTKSLLSELTSQKMVKKLYAHANGRRTLLYPLVGRSTRHFTPAAIASIKATDEIREKAGTSKKDEALRREEIKKAVSEDMLKAVQDNAKEMMLDPAGSLLVTEVLLYAEGGRLYNRYRIFFFKADHRFVDPSATIEAILKPLQAPYPGTATSKHPIEQAHTARMIKTLLQGGHWSHTAKKIEQSELFDASVFAATFVRIVGCENTDEEGSRITAMAQGDGSFVIAELCTRIATEGSEVDKRKLRGWFTEDVVDALQAGEGRGVKTLIQSIETLKS